MSSSQSKPRQTGTEVYDRAVELMAARGYHGTSLRTVAGAVGVQMSSLYYYFPSKQALLMEIMRRTLTDIIAEVKTAIADAEGPAAKFEAGIRAHVEFHANRRLEILITDSELRALEPKNRPKIVKLRDRYGKIFIEILEDGCDQGVFDVPDTRVAMSALLLMTSDVVTWYHPEGRLTIPEIADQYVRLCLHGVGAHQAVQTV